MFRSDFGKKVGLASRTVFLTSRSLILFTFFHYFILFISSQLPFLLVCVNFKHTTTDSGVRFVFGRTICASLRTSFSVSKMLSICLPPQRWLPKNTQLNKKSCNLFNHACLTPARCHGFRQKRRPNWASFFCLNLD